MERTEELYRNTPKGTKKYAKRLTEYINFLISKGKILEAKHFFSLLDAYKPNHSRTIRLGYTLSIASFDQEGVKKFDQLLVESKPAEAELAWFQLKYYLSVTDRKNCERTSEFLLSLATMKREYLDTIFETCTKIDSYSITVNFINHLKKDNIPLNDLGTGRLKKIALQRLVESLVRFNHA